MAGRGRKRYIKQLSESTGGYFFIFAVNTPGADYHYYGNGKRCHLPHCSLYLCFHTVDLVAVAGSCFNKRTFSVEASFRWQFVITVLNRICAEVKQVLMYTK